MLLVQAGPGSSPGGGTIIKTPWRVNRIGMPGLPRKQIVRSDVNGDQDLGSPQITNNNVGVAELVSCVALIRRRRWFEPTRRHRNEIRMGEYRE